MSSFLASGRPEGHQGDHTRDAQMQELCYQPYSLFPIRAGSHICGMESPFCIYCISSYFLFCKLKLSRVRQDLYYGGVSQVQAFWFF